MVSSFADRGSDVFFRQFIGEKYVVEHVIEINVKIATDCANFFLAKCCIVRKFGLPLQYLKIT